MAMKTGGVHEEKEEFSLEEDSKVRRVRSPVCRCNVSAKVHPCEAHFPFPLTESLSPGFLILRFGALHATGIPSAVDGPQDRANLQPIIWARAISSHPVHHSFSFPSPARPSSSAAFFCFTKVFAEWVKVSFNESKQ